jgi:DNA-binding CsgD family transcriptional regulator
MIPRKPVSIRVQARSPITEAGLATLLRAEGFVVAQSEAEHADVMVTDAMPEGAVLPVVCVGPADPAAALRQGARAVTAANATSQELRAAIEAAAAGFLVLYPEDLQQMLHPQPVASDEHLLTDREREVLRLLAEGAANKEIAWRLQISEHTVKFHVSSLMTKLGASSRTEAVTLGLRRGVVLL